MASTNIQTVPSSSTSSSKPHSEYNFFLNFRGEDSFKDDKQVKMAEPIWKELLVAIETGLGGW